MFGVAYFVACFQRALSPWFHGIRNSYIIIRVLMDTAKLVCLCVCVRVCACVRACVCVFGNVILVSMCVNHMGVMYLQSHSK